MNNFFINISIALSCLLASMNSIAMFNDNASFVVLLNGTSCSGKTTLAKEISEQLKKAGFFGIRHLSIDDHFKKNIANTEWYNKAEKQNAHLQGWSKFYDGWHKEMAKSIDEFAPIVVDHVFDYNEIFENFLQNLHSRKVIMVKVHCSKDIAEKRLNERNKTISEQNRSLNIVDRHFNKLSTIHGNKKYDLEIDTSKSNPSDDAFKIILHIVNLKPADAFKQNCKQHQITPQ